MLQEIKLKNFPEKISVIKAPGEKLQIHFYGPKSYNNQLALITHYLHNGELVKESSRMGHRTKRFFQWSGKMGERF